MKQLFAILSLGLLSSAGAIAADFQHIGDFLIRSKLKISGTRTLPVQIKPMRLSAYTDGVQIKVSTSRDPANASVYTIYRSDGIGRQRVSGGPLEVVPGVQAFSRKGGILRQLRLTRDTLTITTFPGVSDQTIVTHATLAADEKTAEPQPSARTEPRFSAPR